MVRNYREGYGLWLCNGILFNHESPRRGPTFVTRKIAAGAAAIAAKKQEYMYLGNLDSERDWGYAPEYVEAMWVMLQRRHPDDFVLGTGRSHSVREFVERAFSYLGLPWEKSVKADKRYFRPTEVSSLRADAAKSARLLNWKPRIGFDDLVKIMIDAEMRAIGLSPIGEGDKILGKIFPQRWWRTD